MRSPHLTAPRRVGAAVLGVATMAIALSGCSLAPQGDRRWVSNSQERMFTRIPKSWKTFEIDPYQVDSVRPTPQDRSTSRWSLIMDSAPKVSLASSRANLNNPLPAHLVAEMSVQPLPSDWEVGSSGTLREDLSPSALRQFSLIESASNLIDPVKAFLDGEPSVEVILNEEVAKKNGLRGSHLRFNYAAQKGKWVTIDHWILLDRGTKKLYRLIIKCESTCFKREYNEAKRISESWTVKK